MRTILPNDSSLRFPKEPATAPSDVGRSGVKDMSEIVFAVEEALEGGYFAAHPLGNDMSTAADPVKVLCKAVRMRCAVI